MNQLLNETEPERPWQLEYADDSTEASDEQLPQTDGFANETEPERPRQLEYAGGGTDATDAIDAQLPQTDGFAELLLADLGEQRRRTAAAERERDELRDQLRAILQFVAYTLADVAGSAAGGRRQWRLWLSQTLIALVLGLLILGAIDYLVSGDAIPILSEPNAAATPAAHGP